MEQWTGSKLGKEYIKALYCHLAYLTYTLSTSRKMPGWMKHIVKVKMKSLSSVDFQARILEWVAISFSRGSSGHRDRTRVSHIVGRCFTV